MAVTIQAIVGPNLKGLIDLFEMAQMNKLRLTSDEVMQILKADLALQTFKRAMALFNKIGMP